MIFFYKIPLLSMVQKLKNIKLHKGDIPQNLSLGNSIAIDTETMGLNINNDRLCLIQISSQNGECHLVQFQKDLYKAPNLVKLLKNKSILKIFHFARFDVAVIKKYLKVSCNPIYCTKIASKLARTFTDKHGLKELCRDLLKVDINKQSQTSDWGQDELTEQQINYAANDVLYLHEIKIKLDKMLEREGKKNIADACFKFLPIRSEFDLIGWIDKDIFEH